MLTWLLHREAQVGTPAPMPPSGTSISAGVIFSSPKPESASPPWLPIAHRIKLEPWSWTPKALTHTHHHPAPRKTSFPATPELCLLAIHPAHQSSSQCFPLLLHTPARCSAFSLYCLLQGTVLSVSLISVAPASRTKLDPEDLIKKTSISHTNQWENLPTGLVFPPM